MAVFVSTLIKQHRNCKQSSNTQHDGFGDSNGHGHGHGVFVLATYYEEKWTTDPNSKNEAVKRRVETIENPPFLKAGDGPPRLVCLLLQKPFAALPSTA